jgi:hypothetical protein
VQLIYEGDSILKAAGYRTARSLEVEEVLVFEDDTVLGFVAVYSDSQSLVESWQRHQDAFLRRHAPQLRRDPSKAWNTYSVFLTGAPVDQTAWTMMDIEADVHATRKIVRGGIITRDDVAQALAPLLPLSLPLGTAERNADAVLKEKLSDQEAALFELVNNRDLEDVKITAWLMETRL